MRAFVVGALIGLLALGLLVSQSDACFQPGDFPSTPPLDYSCESFGIAWSVVTWTLTDLGGGQMSASADPGGLPTLTGTINCADSSFALSGFVFDPFCNGSYDLTGRFTSGTHWSGVFSATYVGYCVCSAFEADVEGTSALVSVPATGPRRVRLAIHPNPVRDRSVIYLDLSQRRHVLVEVLDTTGRRIALLHDAELPAGNHSFPWIRTTAMGERVPAGIYLVRARAGERHFAAKAVVVD